MSARGQLPLPYQHGDPHPNQITKSQKRRMKLRAKGKKAEQARYDAVVTEQCDLFLKSQSHQIRGPVRSDSASPQGYENLRYPSGTAHRADNLDASESSFIAPPLVCCGSTFALLHDLLQHYESRHANGRRLPVVEVTQAVLAWIRRFGGCRQVELKRDEKELFTPGQRLGGGGVGIVYETHLDGIALALKRTYERQITPHVLNEIKILGRISEQRHQHVVQLIGSYIHKQKRWYELGLLIWPVAQIDLAALLRDYYSLASCIYPTFEKNESETEGDLQAAMEPLMFLSTNIHNDSGTRNSALELRRDCQNRIHQSFGCIAQAVAFLHNQRIRHKDLKPSQILLSPDGLWLTDFGWSRDMSEFSQSATSGGDKITTKYEAPERAKTASCARSEDIFALGCIFLEMSYVLLEHTSSPPPWSQKGWSFQSQLEYVQDWLGPLHASNLQHITNVIRPMLEYTAESRPSIKTVIDTLSKDTHPGFFGPCCYPARPESPTLARQPSMPSNETTTMDSTSADADTTKTAKEKKQDFLKMFHHHLRLQEEAEKKAKLAAEHEDMVRDALKAKREDEEMERMIAEMEEEERIREEKEKRHGEEEKKKKARAEKGELDGERLGSWK